MAVAWGGPTACAVLASVSTSALQAALGLPHQAVNLSAGRRVRGSYHIRTANSRHSQFKTFLRPFRGVATKYLDSYLRWFQQVDLSGQPSPRGCLAAALATPCIRFAN